MFFFFQAEDGIRDIGVTGVQTCALPIFTGIRREQALTRANAQKVEWSERYGVWKVQPLVDWDAKRVQAYIRVHEIPYNPLYDAGYPSIGCIPCTRPVLAGEDERAGRWARSDKLECGIHGAPRAPGGES